MSTTLATHGPRVATPLNPWVAERLDRVAELLEAQGASPFRVGAYRRAADIVEGLDRDLGTLVADRGIEGLLRLPGIGRSLAGTILDLVETGRLGLLDRLLGAVNPEELFMTLPGIGPELARRVHEELGVETLEELEVAAWDGRLEAVSGFGPRRVAALRAVLAERLSRSRRRRRARREAGPAPSVAELLAVDQAYRDGASAGTLPFIAPRRFNPSGRAWLPVLHTERAGWSFHVFFSNTPLAHRLGRTRDWVVIYFERNGDEGQATVVTERRGELEGLRVVRGRENECMRHYRRRSA